MEKDLLTKSVWLKAAGTVRACGRQGQAMVELAAGMLALALVLAATFSFTSIILASLEQQGTLRREAGQAALNGFGSQLSTKREPFRAEVSSLIFGHDDFKGEEQVAIPNMGGLGQ